MCRSIKRLFAPGSEATDEEVRAAALQFVRKVSGFRKPSKRNEAAFDQAVDEIASASKRMIGSLMSGRQNSPKAPGMPR